MDKFLKKLKKERELVRMTILGDGAVGKTTLVQALLKESGINSPKNAKAKLDKIKRTPFMEIEAWNHDGVLIQSYDLAGQREAGKHPIDILKDQVFGFIDIYILVFSLHRYESFENLNSWIQLMDQHEDESNGRIGYILVGNKLDLERNVSKELIDSVVGPNKHFDKYIETSATQGTGISQLMNEITKMGRDLLN
jgi:small GTP-binding protein